MSQISVIESSQVTKDQIVFYMESFGIGAQLDQKEKLQFIQVAMAYNLDPVKREVYCLPYGKGEYRKLSIITGFEVYLKRAERSGNLDGWRVWTEGEFKAVDRTVERWFNGSNKTKAIKVNEGNLKAIIEIFRKDRSKPFVHEVFLSEYNQKNEMWGGKPITMLKKVAMAQGFRLCFPDELGGIPYTADELPDEMSQPRNVTPDVFEEPQKPDNYPTSSHAGPEVSGVVDPVTVDPRRVEKEPEDNMKELQEIMLKIGLELTGLDEGYTSKVREQVKKIGKDKAGLEELLGQVQRFKKAEELSHDPQTFDDTVSNLITVLEAEMVGSNE